MHLKFLSLGFGMDVSVQKLFPTKTDKYL